MKPLGWIALFVVLVVLIALLAIPQMRFLFFGLPEERLDGHQFETKDDPGVLSDLTARYQVGQALLASGLSEEPHLGATGVSGHLARLDEGRVSGEQLLNYAKGLQELSSRTGRAGRQIPTRFWDVDSDELNVDGWNAYRVVAAMASPEGRPYLEALSAAYTRFYAFKTSPPDSKDTALDTALDLFQPSIELITDVPPEHRLETSKYIQSDEQAALYFWQQIIVGSSRRNPITHLPIFNHGFTRRFHVGTIWQYETGVEESNSAIWGVTGFAPEYVGPPENNNQVEHMSISMTVQGILREPALVLEAFEKFESLLGSASKAEAEAEADNALNAAVKDSFVSRFQEDLPGAIASLRQRLTDR